MEIEKFEEFLSQGNMAKNTISAYLYAVKEFDSRYKELNKRNLLVYKTYLIETYKPKTVNLRIQAMNKYLVFVGKTKLRLKVEHVQIGYFDIYTKGGKIRRIYIPKTLRTEAVKWL